MNVNIILAINNDTTIRITHSINLPVMLAKKICDKELGPKFVDHYIQIQSNTWLVHNKFGKLFIDA